MKVRTRFAPSPTGPLHMGGVRTALYAYLFAKQHKGQFLLRIEDTDQSRYVPGAEQYIIDALKWCGIIPDEGVGFGGAHEPYRQSERKEKGYYMDYAKQMISNGHAYYAFDRPEQLEEKRMEATGNHGWQYDATNRMQMENSLSLSAVEVLQRLEANVPYVIRLKVEPNQTIHFTDMIRGDVSFDSTLVDDKVLIKADGMPTYHLAHIVDDIMMEITHAIRGEEWLPSAPAHILIYKYIGLGENIPHYAHLPLLLKPEGNGKLSKRDGDRLGFPVFPLEWKDPNTGEISSGYREKGYYAEAFVNMISLLGWNPGTEKEIFSMDELIESFSFERVHKAGARFDPEKAKWFNEQYLRLQNDEQMGMHLYTYLQNFSGASAESKSLQFATGAVRLLKERVQFEHDFYETGKYLFERPETYDEKVVAKRYNEQSHTFINAMIETYTSVGDFTSENCKAAFEKQAAEMNVKPGDVLQLFRVCVSGVGSGVDLFGMVSLLGKQEILIRLQQALEKINSVAAH